jgi:carboxylesterase type B
MYFFSIVFPVWMFLVDASNAIELRSKNAPIGFTRNGSCESAQQQEPRHTLKFLDYGTKVPSLGQDIFLGIPFAYAPRFEVAQSLNSSFTTPKPAITPGLTCSGFGTNVLFGWPVGEDCLNLNIVRPSNTYRAAKLPVLVWIYGGGFVQGSNRDPEFNTSYMVETSMQINKPIIVVSINYRLSGFGLLGGAEMMAAGVLNLAIRDQWKALEWINQNIEGFGGDPNDVTIWGESGGADSVAILLQAYGGNNSGLFKKAIMVSGAVVGSAYLTPAQEQMQFDAVANATGCLNANNILQCLKDGKS